MASRLLKGSDTSRHSRHLRYAHSLKLGEPFRLELGGVLPEVEIIYETYGELNSTRDNAVLVCHALSGDSHVARHNGKDDQGWWEILVGPGRPLDTNHFFVICSNVLGGCRGTTGPTSIDPETSRPYGVNFPTVTVEDMVEVQRHLIDHFGIERLRTVIGGSLGGHQALAWAVRHPDRVGSVIAIATSPRLTSQGIAFDVVGRNAIQSDGNFSEGNYYETVRRPDVGLAIARMLGHITYLSPEAMAERFESKRFDVRSETSEFERKFAVGAYLAHQGETFVERFDANSYVTLSMAMDLFDLGDTPDALSTKLSDSTCPWLVISFTSDWLFPASQSRDIVRALVPSRASVTFCDITTNCGHDAFLLERDLEIYGELVRNFLRPDLSDRFDDPVSELPKRNLFHERLDYDHIIDLIPPKTSVLDLGCGSGGLLHRLRSIGHSRLVGIDHSERAIVECTRRGIPAILTDIDHGLEFFEDASFDTVILSQTLQSVRDVDRVISELLRVGQKAIVSFPNAAHRELRRVLQEEGRAPNAAIPEAHRWFESLPLRLFSILDFEEYCVTKGIRVHRLVGLDLKSRLPVTTDLNLNAELAIFVLSR